MKKLFALALITLCFSGCANTKSRVSKAYSPTGSSHLAVIIEKDSGVSIPEDQYQLLESQIRAGLSQRRVLSSDESKADHVARIKISSFRMRDDAARLAAGIMAGCDNIVSMVIVTAKDTGEEIGKSQVSIKECAAWGVASQVITKYTDGVVAFLAGN